MVGRLGRKKERVLLLNPPGKRLYLRDYYCSHVSKAASYRQSIDLVVLSGILNQNYEVEVLDCIVEKVSPQVCLSKVGAGDYKAIIFLTGTISLNEDFDLLRRLKQRSCALFIGSGDVFLENAEEIIRRQDWLDAGILDFTSEGILNYLRGEFDQAEGMIFRRDGQILRGPDSWSKKEFTLPTPRHELFPLGKYNLPHVKRHPFITLIASVGCPYKCLFCPYEKLPLKLRSLDSIFEELRFIRSMDIREIVFRDATFGSDRTHTISLLEGMIKKKFSFSWLCASRANVLDEQVIKLMKQAGCHTVQIGVESGSDHILKKYNKAVDTKTIKEAFRLCTKFSIKTLAHFILGLPGETREDILRTIAFAKELSCDYASFNVAYTVFGSSLREEAVKKGWVSQDAAEKFDRDFPSCGNLSKGEVNRLRKRATREFYCRPFYLAGMFFKVGSWHQLKTYTKEAVSLVRGYLHDGFDGV